MAFIALIRDPSVSLATKQIVVPAKDVPALVSAVECGVKVRQRHEQLENEISEEKKLAAVRGYAEGHQRGMCDARNEVAVQLISLSNEISRQRHELRASVAQLALQVVRKLAGELGATKVVAGLAETAVKDLLPVVSLTIRVHPTVLEAVTKRLSNLSVSAAIDTMHIDVRGDDALTPFDCILETPCGTTIASLDAQIQQLEAVLKLDNGVAGKKVNSSDID